LLRANIVTSACARVAQKACSFVPGVGCLAAKIR
jgi:hypothetical protein